MSSVDQKLLSTNGHHRPKENVDDNDDDVDEEDSFDSYTDDDDDAYEPAWADSVGPKGDLFYVEPPRTDISTISAIQRHKQQSPRPTKEHNNNQEKKPLRKLKGMMGLKKSESQPRPTNGQVTVTHGVTFQDKPTGLIRHILLFVDPNRNNYGRRATSSESLLGIIPGRFSGHKGSREKTVSKSALDNRIMVQGLVPDGEAMRSCQVKIGDWLMCINDFEVNFDNLDNVLSTLDEPQMVKLTLQKFCDEAYITPPIVRKNDEAENLARFVSGQQTTNTQNALKKIQHCIMFLTLDNDSDEIREKTDVLYQYPAYDSKLIEVRGMFITLCHVMKDACGNSAHSTTVLIGGEVVNVCYAVDEKKVFILALPANKISITHLTHLTRCVARFLNITYGSLNKAFSDSARRDDIDHFFYVLCQRLLLADEMARHGLLGDTHAHTFLDCLSAVRWVWLPEEIKVDIHSVLNELESTDFGEMSDDAYLMRRQYSILGSCLFYKGLLVATHLAPDDVRDLSLYLRFYCLLALSELELMGQIVIWREIFRSPRDNPASTAANPASTAGNAANLGYREPEGRHFLLIVGMKHTLLCVQMEAGGCAQSAEGHPPPDPFYVDQVKATLLQFDIMDLGSRIGHHGPTLVSADWFIPSGKSGREEQQHHQAPTRVPSSPRGKKPLPESILKKRSSPSQDQKKERESDSESLQSVGALSGNSTPSMGRRTFTRNPSLGSEESAGSTGSSNLFRNPRGRRLLPSAYDMTNTKRPVEDDSSTEITVKLTAGSENVLFHYTYLDDVEGVVICPSAGHAAVGGVTHRQIVDNFHLCCLRLKANFTRVKAAWARSVELSSVERAANDETVEEGLLFECQAANWPDTKKQAPTVSYWVVGRISRDPPHELYVCYHDSAPQNMIELAFKLGLGILV